MEYIVTLLLDPVAWAALLTLIAMEVVLGIDNLVFIAILTNKLPEAQRKTARRIGIGAALILRILLLGLIAFIVQLGTPIISFGELSLSWRDIILIVGGLFLIWKATREIHHLVDPDPGPSEYSSPLGQMTMGAAVAQILAIDVVFSLDSIITAVGMTPHIPIMVVAVVVAVLSMLLAAEPPTRRWSCWRWASCF